MSFPMTVLNYARFLPLKHNLIHPSCNTAVAQLRFSYNSEARSTTAVTSPTMSTTINSMAEVDRVHHFWFKNDFSPNLELWFSPTSQTDDKIRSEFGSLVERALDCELQDWETATSHKPLMAKILLVDQFTRNIYRKDAMAFSGDGIGVRCAHKLTTTHLDKLHPMELAFAVLPMEHSEDIANHEVAEKLLVDGIATYKGKYDSMFISVLENFLQYLHGHTAIVKEFGRYPHRNWALGRESTLAEIEYLKTASGFGQ